MSSAIKLDVWNPKYTELYSLLTQNIAKTAKLYETQLIVSIKYILYIILDVPANYIQISQVQHFKGPSKTATWVPARQSR